MQLKIVFSSHRKSKQKTIYEEYDDFHCSVGELRGRTVISVEKKRKRVTFCCTQVRIIQVWVFVTTWMSIMMMWILDICVGAVTSTDN